MASAHTYMCIDFQFILTNTQTRSPETSQGALSRTVVISIIGEEGEVVAVEGEEAGVVEQAVRSHQPS